MPRSLVLLAALLLAFVAGVCASAPASAGSFSQTWSVQGWEQPGAIGNADGDPNVELLISNKADHHFAIFDGLTGAIQQHFPATFTSENSIPIVLDLDGDGRVEIAFMRDPDEPPLCTAYRWNGSTYAPLFSHTDPTVLGQFVSLRVPGQFEFLELDVNEVRVRDLNGVILFRASTDLPGWSGPFTDLRVTPYDSDLDGIDELLILDDGLVRLVDFAGTFTQAWSVSGWSFLTTPGNCDGDPQPEFMFTQGLLGRYGLFDGVTGAFQQDFPDFEAGNSNVITLDTDADGRSELFFGRLIGQPSLLTAYRWDGTSYAPLFSHTDPIDTWGIPQFRSESQFEILETTASDVRLRDMSGAVIFRASTAIPGWTGSSVSTYPIDFDSDGRDELVLFDGGNVRFVNYAGTFTQAWSVSGWENPYLIGSSDGDPQSEIVFANTATGRFAVFDALTGAFQQEFPLYTQSTSFVQALDADGDGQAELFFARNIGEPSLFTRYDWNGSSYVATYSNTDPVVITSLLTLRSPTQWDYVQLTNDDFRVLDLGGNVLLQGADLPDWVSDGFVNLGQFDYTMDGFADLMIMNGDRIRFVTYLNTTGVDRPMTGPGLLLHPNAPNPFRVATALRFSTRREGEVGIRIFDAGGRVVRDLSRKLPAGTHSVSWDGRDDAGHQTSSGVLFYEITADGHRQSRQLVRLGR